MVCSMFYTWSVFSIQKEGFELVKDQNDIKVYHKVKPKKGYVEYMATTSLSEVDLNQFLRFFDNPKKHPLWIYKCIESKVTQGQNATYLYQVVKSTWPMKNRDLSLMVITKKIDDENVTVDFKSAPDAFPENSDNIRIVDFASSWQIRKSQNNLVLKVWACFDPRLSMGNLLLKSYATKIPFETLKRLKELYHTKM